MDWFSGRVSLGNFPDLTGAVNKISESVKNMEKNFDSALGLEEKPEPGEGDYFVDLFFSFHRCRLSEFCKYMTSAAINI